MKQILIFFTIFIACFQHAAAQSQPLRARSISIFKNGQAFFIKSGSLKAADGRFLLPDPAPAALYGTLWFHSPEGSLTKIASYPDTLREKKTESAVAVWDLLRANIGKTATCAVEEKGSVSGAIVSVNPAYFRDAQQKQPVYDANSLVTLKSDVSTGTHFVVPAGQIRYVIISGELNFQIERETVQPRHLFEATFSTKKGEQPLDMMYLSNGLNWAPQYLLELTAETAGTLTLQGEVANDAEDIANTEVNLVVGVPNFAYANRLAYLVDFLNVITPVALRSRDNFNQFSNALSTQQLSYTSDAESFATSEEPEGSRNEDLYFYALKNFSLPKGGRSMQQIDKENVQVAHIYECILPANEEGNSFYDSEFLFSPQKNKTFHTLKLENKTKHPWTTAPILVMNKQGESRPLSQDLMTYTPVGGKTFVKLTEAVEVKVEQAEREVSRQDAAWTDKRRGWFFDLVQVEGKIKVKNFKDKKLDLRLQRTITGNLKTSGVTWQKEEIVNSNSLKNRKTTVCWEPSIGANSELEITYTYEIYVQR